MPILDTTSCSVKVLDAISTRINAGQEDAFFIADVQEVNALVDQWEAAFPTIAPFYAVKCNPDPKVIATLAKRGAGFDCSSLGEMQLVLGLGIDASRVIFANTCKMESHIRFARANGISRLTVDSVEEVAKLQMLYPEADLIVRITTDDTGMLWKQSEKFGAAPAQVPTILAAAKQMGLNVLGVSFHVISECGDSAAYDSAMRDAAQAFATAYQLGFKPTLLDIGGGFIGRNAAAKLGSLEAASPVIRKMVVECFSKYDNLEVISEPGRFFVGSAFTFAARIYAKRSTPESGRVLYYLNDGVYGCLNGKLHGEAPPPFQLFRPTRSGLDAIPYENTGRSRVWGPTCDGFDLVYDDIPLPELRIGDWLLFRNMGAYHLPISTTFNGYPRPEVFFINE